MALLEAAEEPPRESLVQDLYPPAAPPRSAELAPAPSAELAPGYNFHALSRTALPRTDGPQSWLSRHGAKSLFQQQQLGPRAMPRSPISPTSDF